MDDDDNTSSWYSESAPASSGGGWFTGLVGGVGSLATAAGSVIGAIKGNGAGQDNQAQARAQANQAAQASGNKVLLWGAVIAVGLAVIGFILLRKR